MSEPPIVVVGADATSQSEGAVNAAIGLARDLGATLHVVHALDGHGADREGSDERAAEALRVWLEGHLSGTRLEAMEPAAQIVVRRGHPAAVLVEHAREQGAAMIVLGEHHRRGLVDYGSTAAGVTAHASCPVWCQTGPVRETRELLVPVDFSPESDRALDFAVAWATRLGARLVVLHVFQSPEMLLGDETHPVGPTYVVDQARDQDRAQLQSYVAGRNFSGVSHEARFVEGDPRSGILEHLGDADLVVMGTQGRTGLSALLLGNTTRAVLADCPVPVVVTRSSEDAARAWRF